MPFVFERHVIRNVLMAAQLQAALWKAVREDDAENLKFILESITENKVDGESLFRRVLQLHRERVLLFLLKETNIDINPSESGREIFHIVCQNIRSEETFQLLALKINSQIMNYISPYMKENAFLFACKYNTPQIIKIIHQQLKLDVFHKNFQKRGAMHYAAMNKDVEVIKYVSTMIDGIDPFEDDVFGMNALFITCKYSNLDVFLYLFDLYLHKSIPSFYPVNIYQFIEDSHLSFIKNSFQKNINNLESNYNHNHNIDNEQQQKYQKIIEENYQSIISNNINNKKIWHEVSSNQDIEMVQFIYSLKGVDVNQLNGEGENGFLIACGTNENLKVVKYLHKNTPSNIHLINTSKLNAFQIAVDKNYHYRISIKLIKYLYEIGIDIHYFEDIFSAIYLLYGQQNAKVDRSNYLRVISQDFDYRSNPHTSEEDISPYQIPSFWREIDNDADEHSKQVNEWKNRFDEHILHHLSKMIQEHNLAVILRSEDSD